MLLNATLDALRQMLTVIDHLEDTAFQGNKNDAAQFYAETTIGKHIRHVVDHFVAYKHGLEKNLINYNQRSRNSVVETDPQRAKNSINEVLEWFGAHSESEQDVEVISEIDSFRAQDYTFASNTARELLYLINHTIHHAAYIKLLARTHNIELPEHIGIAPCTATYLREQAS